MEVLQERIKFGSREIDYQLTFSDRKSLDISVHPDLLVEVKAPFHVSPDLVKEKILDKASWILKQFNFFLSFEPKMPPRRYVSGESHLYLGRLYRMKVIESEVNVVKLSRGYLYIYTADKEDKERIKEQLYAWYKAHAERKFDEYGRPWLKKFERLGVKPSSIEIRSMEKRWGSCTARDRILLNLELVKAPKECIEYVIVHELCHLIHKNHTQAFWALLAEQMPDWEKWKERLERL
jgi:predicted metal-dependent hydrolase